MKSTNAWTPTQIFKLSLLFIVGLSTYAHAGVYDDCKAWWHFDYDANSDGMADVDEIRDQLDWGTTSSAGSSGFHADYIYGIDGGPAWTNEVISPAGGNTYGGMSMYFDAPTNSSGAVWSDSIKIDDDNRLLHGSATIVTRFRWEGYANADFQKVGWLYNNGLHWSYAQGWLFGIRDNGGTPALGMYIGRSLYVMNSTTLTTDVWYEAAAVLTDNGANDTVELYLWKENGSLTYQKHNSSAVTIASPYNKTTIGAESSYNGYSTGNSIKCFKGAVNHIAVWDRALSSNEVIEAFCYPHPLIQIGLNNNSGNELREKNEVGDTYLSGDPWHTMPNKIEAGSDTSLNIPLSAEQANLDYSFHLGACITNATSQAVNVSLIVNSTQLPTNKLGKARSAYWLIPDELLITGTNTFTLHYEGGISPDLSIDWLEMGGSWQIGHDDNNATTDFISDLSAPDDYYITDSNWKHLERGVSAIDPVINIHFFLSPGFSYRYRYEYTYTTRVVQQWYGSPQPFSIDINGTTLKSYSGLADNTVATLSIPGNILVPGKNEITLTYNSSDGWMMFDFHRLELQPFDPISILVQ